MWGPSPHVGEKDQEPGVRKGSRGADLATREVERPCSLELGTLTPGLEEEGRETLPTLSGGSA